MSALRVTCLQLPARGDRDPGRHADEVVEAARAAAGADLIVLPELWNVGYFAFDDYATAAVGLDGALARRLGSLAAELGATVHAGSVVERGGGLYNTTLVFGPDGAEVGRYRKVHVFGYGSREQELLTAGDEVATFPVAGVRAGMATCYDLRFPELFRAVVDEVALYVVPAAWPAARIGHWRSLLVARAIENQAFVVGCNGAGVDHGTALGGASAVVAPSGQVVAEAGPGPGRLDVDVDLGEVQGWRASFPALADRAFDPPTGPRPGPRPTTPGEAA